MRLWHTDLIEVLPRQQLLSQWRELNSIFANQNKHILINFVYEYGKEHLYYYADRIITEFQNRDYNNMSFLNYNNYFKNCDIKNRIFGMVNCFSDKMDGRYLTQCFYNLQEKYDCGGITQEEWDKIENKFEEVTE